MYVLAAHSWEKDVILRNTVFFLTIIILHCMANQTSRTMQTAPYVQSAKSRMAHFILCVCGHVWLRVHVSLWYECVCACVYL